MNFPPIEDANPWTTPNPAFASVIPDIRDPYAIEVRTSISEAPLEHADIIFLLIYFIPLKAKASVIGFPFDETYASSNWVKASIPQAAVIDIGQEIISSGSIKATFGIRLS